MRNKSTLSVSINGESIKGKYFQEIFENAIFAIGAEKVLRVDPERMLVSIDRITERSCRFHEEQGYWVTSGHGAERIEFLLQRVGRRLPDTDIRVEREVLEKEDIKVGKTTETTKSSIAMEAYVVMLHLVLHKRMTFTDIRDLLSWDEWKPNYCFNILERIVQTIRRLKDEWQEDIPHITICVFDGDGHCAKWPRENFFENKHPTARQIAEIADAIATYDRWGEVLEVLRQEAFEAS